MVSTGYTTSSGTSWLVCYNGLCNHPKRCTQKGKSTKYSASKALETGEYNIILFNFSVKITQFFMFLINDIIPASIASGGIGTFASCVHRKI